MGQNRSYELNRITEAINKSTKDLDVIQKQIVAANNKICKK